MLATGSTVTSAPLTAAPDVHPQHGIALSLCNVQQDSKSPPLYPQWREAVLALRRQRRTGELRFPRLLAAWSHGSFRSPVCFDVGLCHLLSALSVPPVTCLRFVWIS
jgi:hypothetical protein